MNLVEVRKLTVRFGDFAAVRGVSFAIEKGETLGVVGESGSGKTTIARVLCGLQKATSGVVSFAAGTRVAMVFQDPLGSLNPRRTVRATLEEVLRPPLTARELLTMVGLGENALDKFPHEFSGGERQRICIARAVATRPDLLICDEAVSALDLSIRSTILDLLARLKCELGLTLLFITHDLGVVSKVSDRVMVMNHGEIVETGHTETVMKNPQNPYTEKLLAALPRLPDFAILMQ